jgi:Tfp pilus assembly pilus retraction ATPase PilT
MHTKSFSSALKGDLREDPDIILVGEMRVRETVELGLSAAETGHLVLSTLHTIDAGQTINRILGMFDLEEQEQIRHRLSDTLRWIVSKRGTCSRGLDNVKKKRGDVAGPVERLSMQESQAAQQRNPHDPSLPGRSLKLK